MPRIVIALLLGSCAVHAFARQTARPPKPGVKTPGVKIPIERLKPEAVFPYEGNPDWIAVDEAVWVSNAPKDTIARFDPKTNTVAATITTGTRPCSGLAAACGSVGVPNCRDNTMVRVDTNTNAITETIDRTNGDADGSRVAR